MEHRFTLKIIDAGEIPLIDLSAAISADTLSDSNADIAGLAAEVGEACRRWGFFQVVNHGVPDKSRRGMESAAKEFFAQPEEEKLKVKRSEWQDCGYHNMEQTDNVTDWKEVFDMAVKSPAVFPASHEPDDEELRSLFTLWPEYPPELREAFEEYVEEMEKLVFKLLGLISLSLGLPADRFNGFFKDKTGVIRLNHYPPCPFPHMALGVGPHKDAYVLTIVAQDNVGGLEVKRKSDGEWVFVKPTPDAFIINVGDIIQVWSNDAYESVEHRVTVNSEKERFSIPYFLIPSHYVNLKPLEELTSEESPAKYREYNWGKFFTTRRRSIFKKLDVENMQIHHFKIQD